MKHLLLSAINWKLVGRKGCKLRKSNKNQCNPTR